MTIADVKARILEWYDETTFAKRRKLGALQAIANRLDPKIEAAAKMLHNVRHPRGYAHTCGKCIQDSLLVAWALTDETPSKREAAS